ncbi:MAG TPA: porphobilinogen synthase [Trueperaceae bacterium]|nr:porphobilinogen synthase [Trueperaceae bacterium]
MADDLPLPTSRPRRLRSSEALRSMVAETHLLPRHLILPVFVVPGSGERQEITSLPGVLRYSVDTLLPRLEHALTLGVRGVMLFGVVPGSLKSVGGAAAAEPDGPVASAVRAARRAFGDDLVIMSDVCLCAYTTHGHCGVLGHGPRGVSIDNDASLGALAAMAVAHAEAGVDLVAPSDMMDGRVGALRSALDGAGHSSVGIMSYAVKYASAFYGPFREAAGSAPTAHLASPAIPIDRQTYQMDPSNAREALREAALDELEGADMLMVKPALPYLDVLARLRPTTSLPLVTYMVSGEYAMLKAAAAVGALDEARAVHEALLATRRAGADLILSYHAVEAVERGWLQ